MEGVSPKRGARVNKELEAGISTGMEAAIVFYRWAESLGGRLTPARIKEHYGCSRATSYRYLNAFRNAQSRLHAQDQIAA